MIKLRVNDIVKVIAGKDKGKEAKITKVIPKQNRVIVEGINQYKRHLKSRGKDQPGGIVQVERPINISKVMLVSPHTGKPTRVGIERSKTGEIIRVCKQSGKPIDDTKKSK